MVLSGAGLLVPLIVGAIAGWLAGAIVKGRRGGVPVSMAVGIVGALLAPFLFPALGWRMGAEGGVPGAVVFSAIGAVILLAAVRLFNRG